MCDSDPHCARKTYDYALRHTRLSMQQKKYLQAVDSLQLAVKYLSSDAEAQKATNLVDAIGRDVAAIQAVMCPVEFYLAQTGARQLRSVLRSSISARTLNSPQPLIAPTY
jgi:hypothetical protein